jgi:PBP1b-binding outer membrane lipoprotein LpoB
MTKALAASCQWHAGSVVLAVLLAAALAGGCSSNTAVSHGRNTALDSVDLTTMTDQMARSLAAEPRVRQEQQRRNGPMVVVVQPVENKLTGEILPSGQAELFTARVRMLLAPQTKDFTWVMNRDAFYRLQKSERDLDLGLEPGRVQPEYALTARFSSLTDETTKRRTAYYLCQYFLTHLQSGTLVWSDKYEVKKTAVKGFLD